MNAWNPPDPSDRVPEPEREATVTFVLHSWLGIDGDHLTVTANGYVANVIRNEYGTLEAQRKAGITVLPDRWTVDAVELPY